MNSAGLGGRTTRILAVAIFAILAIDVGAVAAHEDPLTWRRVAGPGFSATFPGPPKSDLKNVSVHGTNVAAHLLVLDSRHRHSFGLLYADYPGNVDVSNPRAVLDGAAKGSATSISGRLTSTTPGTAAGQPSVDYVITVPERTVNGKKFGALVIRGRSILAAHRLYSLLVGTPKDDPADFRRFVGSFRLAG
ncbi:MAG TPA: hypothetical protein VFA83_20155 [Acidimicrobiales bacterium]|nr:hypothetical protein [Acidimicrobiales bacterium]